MEQIDEILEFLHYHPNSKRTDVEQALSSRVSAATMKRILADGISRGLVAVTGQGKATSYSITPRAHLLRTVNLDSYYALDIDQRQVQTGYNFELIRKTMPAVEIFTADELNHLADLRAGFAKKMAEIPAGAYNREMERLGIDLSWKSAQIEGNTYTLLETETLLKDLQEAKGKKHEEAVMLLNHKNALKAIDTVLAVYTGSSVGALTSVAYDDDNGEGLTSRVDFNATKGTTYYIAVSGVSGEYGDIVLNLQQFPEGQTTISKAGVSANGKMQFSFKAQAGKTYYVQCATMLANGGNWTTVQTIKPSVTTVQSVEAAIDTSKQSGFYRIVTAE